MAGNICETLRTAQKLGIADSCPYSSVCNGEECLNFELTRDLTKDPEALAKSLEPSTPPSGIERFFKRLERTIYVRRTR